MTSTKLYDRFQKEVKDGDVVYLLGRTDIMWRVQKVAPSLQPGAPPGLVELHLVAVFAMGLPGGTPVTDMIKVRDAEDLKQPPVVQES